MTQTRLTRFCYSNFICTSGEMDTYTGTPTYIQTRRRDNEFCKYAHKNDEVNYELMNSIRIEINLC